jgi:formylglycine-generating enzyme required for sulfatase activity
MRAKNIFNMVLVLVFSGVNIHIAYSQQLKGPMSNISDVTSKDENMFKSGAKEFKESVADIQFVNISGGCFKMGDTFGDGEKDEQPVHKVCVSDFAISKTDITVGQFKLFVEATNYQTEAEKDGGCYIFNGKDWIKQPSNNWKNPGFMQNNQHPVICVAWNDVQAFINWLNKPGAGKFRLPTEAEWEYSARSGGKKERFAGFNNKNLLYKFANFCDTNCDTKWQTIGQNDGYSGTSPAGNYQPNGLGLHDMTGNVWQWLNDWYDERYYSKSPKDNPRGATSGVDRVVRGGSWLNGPNDVRAADRNNSAPNYRSSDIGFRIVSQ